jgi:hypothetical protein
MAAATHRSPLRLGILGCANIARQFARDVAPSRALRIDAVASRDAAKAAAFAAEFGIARSHGSYEALLADRRSTRSTSRCPTACMRSGRCAPQAAASTCCARSRWR